MPKILLNLIEDLYRGTSCQVRLKGSLSAPFRTHSGVRQGCVLAPAVFCRAIDWILRQALSNCGVNISSTTFTDTDYADDIAVLDSEEARLEDTLARIESESSKLGLHISWAKTKIQNLGSGPPASSLVIQGQQVDSVSQFCYLGSVLDANGSSRTECLRRIGIASSCMNNLSNIWKQAHLSLGTKLRLYSTLILPVLLYGSETWTLNKYEISRLEAFHMQCQRRILNIRWFNHVRNADVTLRTGLASIESRIRRMRHSLFGHVVRLNPDAPAHQVLALHRDISMARRIPTGWRRPSARPRTTWLDHIKADTLGACD